MAKCSCNHCGQHIEFDDSMVDTEVNCPSCGMDTTLFFPGGVRPVIKVEKPPPKVVESRVPESHFSHQGSVDIPSDQSSQSGNAVSSIIPYKNVPALLSYYFGIFSFFVPCLGPLTSIILGIIGLIKVKNNPAAKGTVHATVGIVLSVVWTFAHLFIWNVVLGM